MTRKHLLLIFILFLSLSLAPVSLAHMTGTQVIADTDGGLDDIRALSMLLDSRVTDIRLITTSDGVVSPQRGLQYMRNLTRYLHAEVSLACGEEIDRPAPEWRAWNAELDWPAEAKHPRRGEVSKNAPSRLAQVIAGTKSPIALLCLGPLTNVARALELHPGLEESISRIIYVGGPPESERPGWNTQRDPRSAQKVFASPIPIYCLNPPEKTIPLLDKAFLEDVAEIDSKAAQLLTALHQTKSIQSLLARKHLRMWDDLVPVYLAHPELFRFAKADRGNAQLLDSYEASRIQDIALRLLRPGSDYHIASRKPVTLRAFPRRPSQVREDISPYVRRIIARHGLEEWKVCWLTSELHRHLGTYSLVGAKMGLRAREVLQAPLDGLDVISLAGDEPPLSCLNDGLQVATGASLGRGNIDVSDVASEPAAIFIYQGQKLRLRLKKDYQQQIRSQIQKALQKHGGLNEAYFRHIRKKSLQSWLDLDRKQIFQEDFL